jgi:hypothetical protein
VAAATSRCKRHNTKCENQQECAALHWTEPPLLERKKKKEQRSSNPLEAVGIHSVAGLACPYRGCSTADTKDNALLVKRSKHLKKGIVRQTAELRRPGATGETRRIGEEG